MKADVGISYLDPSLQAEYTFRADIKPNADDLLFSSTASVTMARVSFQSFIHTSESRACTQKILHYV